MKPCVLLAGLSKQITYNETYDYIGIDRGALTCVDQKIPLICAIGDFDSVSEEELERIQTSCEVIQLPTHKNETDSEAAIEYAIHLGYEQIILFGGLGGRIDHELANLHLLIYRYPQLILMNEKNRIRLLGEGSYDFKREYKYLSFLALESSMISESSVAYPLENERIEPKDIFTISNEILDVAHVQIHYGRVLMMESED